MSAEQNPAPVRTPADDHVHSEFSYDTGPSASMRASCERAIELGVPSIAFTEHLEFTSAREGDAIAAADISPSYGARRTGLDIDAYLACIEECRGSYPSLRVLSGLESGQPHLFGASEAAVLAGGRFDRVLGSCHAVVHGGSLVEIDTLFAVMAVKDVVRRYFAEVLAVVQSSSPFQVLAHVDFVGRYLPAGEGPYDDAVYEEEYREVFRALAGSGRALEVNTKSRLTTVDQLRWWYEAGGTAVTFGSDAHVPWGVGSDFRAAVAMAEAAGFRPGRHPVDWWRR
jgi:histidinol-phosphatase (PHP family)